MDGLVFFCLADQANLKRAHGEPTQVGAVISLERRMQRHRKGVLSFYPIGRKQEQRKTHQPAGDDHQEDQNPVNLVRTGDAQLAGEDHNIPSH